MTKFITTLGLLFVGFLVYSQDYQDLKCNDIGVSLMKTKRYTDAIMYFDKAIQLNAENSIFYLNRGYCYMSTKEFNHAKKDFLHCSEMLPDVAEYYYLIGLCYNYLGGLDSSMIYYNRAIGLDGTKFDYYYHRGIANMKLDSLENAIQDFDTSLKLNPVYGSSYYNRGQAKAKLKQVESACFDWQVALCLDSSLVISQYELKCGARNFNSWQDIGTLPKDVVATEPRFQNGDNQLLERHIAQKVSYPAYAQAASQQGRVILKYTVKANGEIAGIQVVNSVSKLIDDEAKKVLESTKDMWTGGTVNGIPADFEYTLPIRFLLEPNLDKIDQLEKKGEEALKNNDYTTAIDCYSKILKIDPYDERVLRNRAITYLKMGQKSNADTDLEAFAILNRVMFKFNLQVAVPENVNLGNGEVMTNEKVREVRINYDSHWYITKKDSATFYRISKWRNDQSFFSGTFCDYYNDGHLLARGNYDDYKIEGEYLMYYNNGAMKSKGLYKNNSLDSIWTEYYETGKPRFVVDVKNGDFDIVEIFDVNGISTLSAEYSDFQIEFNGKYKLIGAYLNGAKEGSWKLFMDDVLVLEEYFKNGVFKKGVYYAEDSKKYKLTDNKILAWVFSPYYLVTVENFVFKNEEVKNDYGFIKPSDVR